MRMATSLDTDTVCEGVETKSQVQFLREIGCSKLQGYYYSKPIPFDAIRAMHKSSALIENENPEESDYYESVGKVNLFDLGVVANDDHNAIAHTFSNIASAVPPGCSQKRARQLPKSAWPAAFQVRTTSPWHSGK